MLPLYTSYVSAGDYGRIELLMSAMAVAVVVIRGGANFGFIRFYFLDKDPDYRRRLIRTVFWAQMAYSTLALTLCIVFAPQIANVLGVAWQPGRHLQGSGTSLVDRHRRPALGERQLRPDDEPVPGRAAVGCLLLRDDHEHRDHRLAHGDPRRRLQGRPARDHRRQPQRHTRRLHRAARLPPRAARPPVRPEAPALPQPLRVPADGSRARDVGDELRRPLHAQPGSSTSADAITQVGQYSLANKVSQATVLLFTAFQIAWPAFAYSIEDEEAAKRAYSYVLTYLMFIAAWAAVGLSLFAPWIVHFLGRKPSYWPAEAAVPALAFAQRLLRRLHRRDDRHRPAAPDAIQLGRRRRRRRSSTSRSTSG